MKKLLLFAMGAMVSMTSFAQEEDVTSYIKNAGFDEDLTWQADGSRKATVDTKNLSDRSIAAIAADGSLYATVNPSTPKKRSDGRTFEATNGFVGAMQGWEWVNTDDETKTNPRIESKACEWVYFGALPYDLGETAIPVADDGAGFIVVPSKPEEFDGGQGALYLRAGWTNSFAYKQVVKLPCAVYRLEYWTINANPNSTVASTDLTKIVCRKDVFKEEDGAALNATVWTKHEVEFTPTAEFTIQFGVKSGNGNSNQVAWMFIDGIKLYKIGEANKEDIFRTELDELSGEAMTHSITSLSTYFGEYAFVVEDMLNDDDSEATVKKIEAKLVEFKNAIEKAIELQAQLAKIDNILRTTNYPGKDALNAAYEKLNGYLTTYKADVDVVALIMGANEEAKAAIKDYYLSQVDVATAEAPADLTIFIKNPWFINEDAEPTQNDGFWEFPKQFGEDGTDLYKEGDKASPDLNSEGWYIAGEETGGDQRLNWQRGRSCWNAWFSGSTKTIAVAQDITGLPNGYYTLSADLITQTDCANDQHVFLKTITDKKVSAAQLTEAGWDNSEWTTISMTADEKILVVNGKLTIGAEGTGTGSGSAGWFLATNFKLNFVGKATQEEIEKAINAVYTATLDSANAYAATMHFKADQQALKDTIAMYQNGDKALAIEKIDAALDEAKKSEAKYFDYLPTEPTAEVIAGKTLLWVKEILAGNAVEGHIALGASKPIVQFAYDYVQSWMAGDSATYTKLDETVNLLKNYVNIYAPVYEDADTLANKVSEPAKSVLVAAMTAQKDSLTKEMNTYEQVNAYAETLKKAINDVKKQETFEKNKDASDFTAFITNPNIESETGWEFNKGNGNTNSTSGQWFDGSNTRYLDSYNSSGLQGYIASQLIQGLPNGTYTVGAYVRTPAEGAYIFAGVGTDTTFVMIPLSYHETQTVEGVDTTVIASDQWGPMWEEAYQAYLSGEQTPEQEAIYMANGENGRGWKHLEIKDIVVTNHELLIGTMAGTADSKTEKVFAGSWYSVGGWTLTRTAKGNDGDWTGPITGIQNVEPAKLMADGIYTLTGVKANQLQRGLNIVVRNGKALKVMVK